METRTIRRTSVALPDLESGEADGLAVVTTLDDPSGQVREFSYVDNDLRELALDRVRLADGRISGLRTQRARFQEVRADSVEFSNSDLAGLRWANGKLSRVSFVDCKLMGATIEDVTLDNVLFENCRFDFSNLTRIRAAGPVIFANCSLVEATLTGCDLSGALFSACDLRQAELAGGRYRGCDLRDNDLSAIRGLAALTTAIIDRPQLIQLAEALAAELDLTFGDDEDPN